MCKIFKKQQSEHIHCKRQQLARKPNGEKKKSGKKKRVDLFLVPPSETLFRCTALLEKWKLVLQIAQLVTRKELEVLLF